MTATEEAEIETPYRVPEHLTVSESIGPIPMRVFWVGLVAGVLGIVPAALAAEQWDTPGAVGVYLLCLLVAAPFGAWFLAPPAEHGLLCLLRHTARQKVLSPDQVKHLQKVRIEGGVIYLDPERGPTLRQRLRRGGRWSNPLHTEGLDAKGACRAVFVLPTVNLDLASLAAKRKHRGEWGSLLDGLRYPLQIVIRARPLGTLDVLEDIREHGSEAARNLAGWLADKLGNSQLVERERFLVVSADDLDTLRERVVEVVRLFRARRLDLRRIESSRELRRLVNSFWTPFPDKERVGPAMVHVGADDLVVDGEYVRLFNLGKLPPVVTTDWWSNLTDGDLAVDVAIDVEPRDMTLAKFDLDKRLRQLETSGSSPARKVGLYQVERLRMALEERRVLPFTFTVTFAVRGKTRDELDKRSDRLKQRLKDRGDARAHLLRWEQLEGLERMIPMRKPPLPKRSHNLESGTLARTTPLSSSTLQLAGGVPWGETESAPILFTTYAGQKNAHMCWYGTSGAGKGFGIKCYLCREHFQNDMRIFVVDSDEQHEYAGRFCDYLQGRRVPVTSLADLDALELARDAGVVVFDLSACPDDDAGTWGLCFARIKELVQAHVLQYPASGKTAFVVDEATMAAEDAAAAVALGDAIARWRHFGIAVHVITQRPSDWFNTALGRRVQGNAGTWWCGQQSPREVDEVSNALRLSASEKEQVERAGRGQGLLVTLDRRVWTNLFEKASPAEYAAFHTDPEGSQKEKRRIRRRGQTPMAMPLESTEGEEEAA